jgi:hypothetical protein
VSFSKKHLREQAKRDRKVRKAMRRARLTAPHKSRGTVHLTPGGTP